MVSASVFMLLVASLARSFAAGNITDAEIIEQVVTASGLDNKSILVKTENSKIFLSGKTANEMKKLDSQGQKGRAESGGRHLL